MQQRILTIAAALAALIPSYGQKLSDPKAAALEKFSTRQIISGRPFSATEERHSLQILADGTRIESRQTDRLYRDADGRTRVEESSGDVTLLDPKTGLSVSFNPSTKMILNKKANAPLPLADQLALDAKKTVLLNSGIGQRTETLLPQEIGGVFANGTRTTTIIPAGAIGNDRPINIVTERWYSEELQIMVKSTNSDPRFGETSYQVTDIVRGPQDPALFQIPGDYVDATKASILDELKRKKLDAAQQERLAKKPPVQ